MSVLTMLAARGLHPFVRPGNLVFCTHLARRYLSSPWGHLDPPRTIWFASDAWVAAA